MEVKEAILELQEYILPRLRHRMSPFDVAVVIGLISLKTLDVDMERAQNAICADLFESNEQN